MVGLVYLKPRLAKWRYQRGSRSLVHNLQQSADEAFDLKNEHLIDETDDEDIVVPEEIEEIIEELLQALRSPSSDVRWSAAKGLGRVTNRLPKSLGKCGIRLNRVDENVTGSFKVMKLLDQSSIC